MNNRVEMKSIGFFGIGLMGKPMASNLLKAGYQLTVWNRTKEKAESLRSMGAIVAENSTEAAQDRKSVV